MNVAASADAVGVLVCTYHRNRQLALLLADLLAQSRAPDELIVVDNDPAAGARDTVAAAGALAGFRVHYAVETQRGIAAARNRAVALSSAAWLAFVDDDERAGPNWLRDLLQCAVDHDATGVLGPVLCLEPDHAPAWIRRGNFYALPRRASGSPVPVNAMFIGNALLRADRLRQLPGPFCLEYGLSGGEDTELFARLSLQGARIVWCDEAVLTEPVTAARLSLRWLLMRAMSGGQIYGRVWLAGGYGPKNVRQVLAFTARSLAQTVAGAAIAPLLLMGGRHRATKALRTALAGFGKLSALMGGRFQQYRNAGQQPARIPSKPASHRD